MFVSHVKNSYINCFRDVGPAKVIISDGSCTVFLIENFLLKGVSEVLISSLDKVQRTTFNKRHVGWYSKHPYSYGSFSHPATQFSLPLLDKLLDECNNFFSIQMNSVMFNVYEDGSKSIPWHADDEIELGIEPTIISISIGATRTFLLRKNESGSIMSIPLGDSSVLVMAGLTQSLYEHAVLPEVGSGLRINITLRQIFL